MVWGEDWSKCKICGDTNPHCLCSFYTDEQLIDEINRRGIKLVTFTDGDAKIFDLSYGKPPKESE